TSTPAHQHTSTPAHQQLHAIRAIHRRSWHATSIKFSSQHAVLAGGHQRQNAVDFRVETSIKSTSFGNPVSRSTTSLVDKIGSGTKIKP
ncbi:hypothetical protein, partial [Pantoea agglomerans]|uniref:hypothetical protein n=1 Tax=Enterobacter agglomerans TaxID=549 RepID=UPI001A91D202